MPFAQENGIELSYSEDYMEAYVSLKQGGKAYSKEEVLALLSEEGISENIHEDMIEAMLRDKTPEKKYLAAVCSPPVNGEDGWYEFLFDTDINTKPKILKDGSVDYSEYGNVPFVNENDVLVVYHAATESKDSVNFKGEVLVAKKGKELAKLRGKGFTVSEDGLTYYAKTAGRAKYLDDRLVVENELVIDGDVSYSTGDVNYEYDIHVRGNVLTGVVIASAKGSIVVDGYVEACELYAGKEVVLKNGMQGSGKGKIVAGGSVSGKFFEQTNIQSGLDVSANAIMNSNVVAKQDIIVSGRFGIIIGGEIRAERYVSATIIGNMSEVRTRIFVGVEEDLFGKLMKTEKELVALEDELKKIEEGVRQVEAYIAKTQRQDLMQQKLKLIRSKVEKSSQISEKMQEKQKIMDQMSRVNAAKVTASKMIYPGTVVSINGIATRFTQETSHAQITAAGTVTGTS